MSKAGDTPRDQTAAGNSSRSVKQAAGRGGIYQVLAGGWEAVVRLAASAVLARLLTPDSFGLVALSMMICELFGQVGTLSSTTGVIAKPETDENDLNSAFWLGLLVYCCLFVVTNLAAPLLASLLAEERLSSAIHVASVILLFKGLSAVHSALLHKRLQFGRMVCISGVAVVFEMVTAVCLVTLAGMTYWALILAMIGSSMGVSIAYIVAAKWRPRWSISKASLQYLLPYGLNGLGVNGCVYLAQNVDRFLVGKMLGVNALGLYSFSYRLPDLVLRRLAMPVGGTVLPALSTLGGNCSRIVSGYAKAARYTALLTFPMLCGLIVLAKPIVLLLWGQTWLPCVPALQILCLPAMISSIASSSGAVFLCTNRPRILTNIGIVRLVATVILVPVCGYLWGLLGISAGTAASALVSYLTTLHYLQVVTGESPVRILKSIWPACASSIMCAASAYGVSIAMAPLGLSAFWMLLVPVATGAGVYFISLRMLFSSCWGEVIDTLGIVLRTDKS